MTERDVDPALLEAARESTRELRERSDPAWWQALRDRLATSGVDPSDAAVGSIYGEDEALYGGVVATRDGRAFRFQLGSSDDPEASSRTLEDVELTEWEAMDPTQAVEPELQFVALARAVLEDEKGNPGSP